MELSFLLRGHKKVSLPKRKSQMGKTKSALNISTKDPFCFFSPSALIVINCANKSLRNEEGIFIALPGLMERCIDSEIVMTIDDSKKRYITGLVDGSEGRGRLCD